MSLHQDLEDMLEVIKDLSNNGEKDIDIEDAVKEFIRRDRNRKSGMRT